MSSRRSFAKRTVYRGFTLVEILITITIISCIAIIAYVGAQGYIKRSYNSERIADIERIKHVLSEYSQTNKILPNPRSNAIRYDQRGVYAHSASGSYGISWYLSRDLLGAKYTSTNMVDPETKQYYAYGKLADETAFDLSTVLYEDGTYRAYLRGTYSGKDLVSLIRAYASSDFVVDGSVDSLPYNPVERKITAHITSWSGAVSLSSSASLTWELNTGDTITVWTGGVAIVSVSDGSELSIGSSSGSSMLELSNLSYSDEHNLVSRVALYLRSGEVWTRAPELRTTADERSEFSIQSDTAVAAVRGTIFGLMRDPAGSTTSIMLAAGRIETMQKSRADFIDPSTPSSMLTAFVDTRIFGSSTGSYSIVDGHTYMENADGSETITLSLRKNIGWWVNTSTGTIDTSEIEKRFEGKPYSNGYRPRLLSISASTGAMVGERDLLVRFENHGADRFVLSFRPDMPVSGGVYYSTSTLSGAILSTNTTVSISGSIANTAGSMSFRICRQMDDRSICSSDAQLHLPANTFSWDNLNLGWERLQRSWDPIADASSDDNPSDTADDNNVCGDWQSIFGDFGCQDKNLIAYAPYDANGDFRMYVGSWQSAISRSYNTSYYGSGYPTLALLSGSTTFSDASLSWQNSPSSLYATSHITKIWTGGIGWFYTWDSEATGILIPSGTGGAGLTPSAAWLRYNIGSNRLTWDYRIELGIRGAALSRTRSSPAYQLAYFSSSYGSWFRLGLLNSNLVACSGNSTSCLAIATTWIDTTKQYTVRYTHSDGVNSLSLLTKDGAIASNWLNTPTLLIPITSADPDYLYVGCAPDSKSEWAMTQWNDLIDYIKIYR